MTCILKSAGVQLAEWRASLEYLTSKSAEHRPQRGSKHLKQTALSPQFGDIYEWSGIYENNLASFHNLG